MIDSNAVRKAFRARILTTAKLFDKDACAWESRAFNPEGKTIWYRETLLPVSGAAVTDSDECLQAIMQYDVFVKHASGTETAEAQQKAIADLFEPTNAENGNGIIQGTGIVIAVYEVTPKRLPDDGLWDGFAVMVKFKAYNGV